MTTARTLLSISPPLRPCSKLFVESSTGSQNGKLAAPYAPANIKRMMMIASMMVTMPMTRKTCARGTKKKRFEILNVSDVQEVYPWLDRRRS